MHKPVFIGLGFLVVFVCLFVLCVCVLFLFLNLVTLQAAEKTTIAESSGLRAAFLNANSITSLTSPLNAGSSEVLGQQSDFL